MTSGEEPYSGQPSDESRLADIHALWMLLTAMSALGDEQEGARLVATGIPRIVPCELAVLALVHDPESDWQAVIWRRDTELSDRETRSVAEELEGLFQGATEQERLILGTDSAPVPRVFETLGVGSMAVLPVRTANNRLGLLLAARADTAGFTRSEHLLLATLAEQLGLGIENMRLQGTLEDTVEKRTAQLHRRAEELHRSREEHRQLLELTNAIIGTSDRVELFDSVSGALSNFVEHDRAVLLLRREGVETLELYALSGSLDQLPWPLGTALEPGSIRVLAVIDGKGPQIVADLSDGPLTSFEKQLVEIGIRGLLAVPLMARDRLLGVLAVASRNPSQYTEEDADLLMRVGAQIALAVEKLLAFEEINHLNAQLEQENLYLQEEIRTEHDFEEIVGESQGLLAVLKAVETVAPTDATVLLTGETGTGKELIARAVHSLSDRASKPLVKLNCATIPEGLVESELFGHEKGAFTGALTRKIGRFQLADRGTIFLDEIGDLPIGLQSKLLRILQEGEFERIGSGETIKVDVRIIAATNQNLDVAVADGRFRLDLYYRLNVFPIEIPPLRERKEDIPLLVRHFSQKFGRKMRKPVATIPAADMERLTSYSWPGNVRELQNVVERAVILSRHEDLELSWFPQAGGTLAAPGASAPQSLRLDDVQRTHILEVLEQTNWKVSGKGGAAELLDLKPTTLQYRMKKLGIER